MHCINLRFSSVATRPFPSELGWRSLLRRRLTSSTSVATRQCSNAFGIALAAPSVGVRRGFTARCGPRGCWRGTSSRATMCSTPSVRNIWWNIPTCSTRGPTWTLEGQACRGERTDARANTMPSCLASPNSDATRQCLKASFHHCAHCSLA